MIVAVRGKYGISQVEDYRRVRKCFPNLFATVKGKVVRVLSVGCST